MAAVGACLAAALASAGGPATTNAGPPVTITVSSAGRTVVVAPDLEAATEPDGGTSLRLTTPLDVEADGVHLGTVSALQIGGTGPTVALTFLVTAGPSDTTFTVTSALLTFPSIVDPLAYTSAGITVTDVNGDGATVTGNQAGGNSYEALLNGSGWQQLVPTTAALADDTAVMDDRAPASGETSLTGSYASMQSQFNFTLTAQDTASGTSNVTIAPSGVINSPALAVEVERQGAADGRAARIEPRLVAGGDGEWAISEPFEIVEDGHVLGRVDALRVLMVPGDPSVLLGFAVTAGSVPVTFTLTSALLSFTPIVNPVAHASAGVTVTDRDADGATLTGQKTGGKALEARYNTSTAWTTIVDSTSSLADDTAAARDRRPATDWETIPATVSNTQIEWEFTLSANDSASGTSRFAVAEAPAEPIPTLGRAGIGLALLLFSLLGFLALRRG